MVGTGYFYPSDSSLGCALLARSIDISSSDWSVEYAKKNPLVAGRRVRWQSMDLSPQPLAQFFSTSRQRQLEAPTPHLKFRRDVDEFAPPFLGLRVS